MTGDRPDAETLANWRSARLRLQLLLESGIHPTTVDLGDLAWLGVFPIEDLSEFATELTEALIAAYTDGNTRVLDGCIDDWRRTARELEDPLRRSVLLEVLHPTDLVEAPQSDDE